MGLINKPTTYATGDAVTAANLNSLFDTIYDEFNGDIGNANIAADAAIAWAKLNKAGSVLGDIDDTDLGSAADGDILYRDADTWKRLAKADDGNVLQLASGIPSWVSAALGLEVTEAVKSGDSATTEGTMQDAHSITLDLVQDSKYLVIAVANWLCSRGSGTASGSAILLDSTGSATLQSMTIQASDNGGSTSQAGQSLVMMDVFTAPATASRVFKIQQSGGGGSSVTVKDGARLIVIKLT